MAIHWTNLASRDSDFAHVDLDFNRASVDTPIRVHVVSKCGDDFILYPKPEKALDCFHHPFAYVGLALNGKA